MGLFTDKGQVLADELANVGVTDFAGTGYLSELDNQLSFYLDDFFYSNFTNLWEYMNAFIIALLALWTIIQVLRWFNGHLGSQPGDVIWQLLKAPILIAFWSSWEFVDETIFAIFMNTPMELGSVVMTGGDTGAFGVDSPLMALDLYARKMSILIELLEIEGSGFQKYIYIISFNLLTIFLIIPLAAALLLAKMGITVSLALAPIFVTAAMFDLTKGLFEGWLKDLAASSVLIILAYAIMGLVLHVMNYQTIGLSRSIADDGIRSGSMTSFIIISSIIIYYVWQIQNKATAIAGSMALKPFTPGAGTLAAGALAHRIGATNGLKTGFKHASSAISKAIKQAFTKG